MTGEAQELPPSLRTVFRLVAVWDLVLTLPFALPGVNVVVMGWLGALNSLVSPDRAFGEFPPLALFFVQLFGVLAVLWAVVRIHRPSRFLAAYDTLGRAVVAAAMVGFTLTGGSVVPALFSVSELGFGLVQAVLLLKKPRASSP